MTIINLPAKSWEHLSQLVQAHVVNQSHRQTGRVQPSKVRLDVPPNLASALPAEYAPLVAWLGQQGLQILIFGSRRSDARLEIK